MYQLLNCLFNKFLRPLKFLTVKVKKYLVFKLIVIYIIAVSILTILASYKQSNVLSEDPTESNEIIQCHFPQLSLNNPDLIYTHPKNIQPKCQTWFHPIVIENYHIRLNLSYLSCNAVFHLGQGDKRYEQFPVPLVYNISLPLLSDHFTVECQDSAKGNFYPRLPYASIHYNLNTRQRLESFKNVNNNDDDFNILTIGMDSISKLQFQRMLPRTYEYITKQLNGDVLQGYNILGDGTPQQLIPMLTGFTETELPSTLFRNAKGSFVDVYPFIWNKFREHGYVTGYAEDRTEYGIWTLRLKGFEKTPTDHYLVPFYRMKATKSLFYRKSSHCIRNQNSFAYFLSYIEQFWLSYPTNKKFFFGFFKQYSHDGYEAGSLLDSSLLNFLENFYKINENTKRTIVIIMTDHGARFSSARQTPQGKLEERLPFMSFIFPESFKTKYPNAIKNFKKNLHRLTTPFDIHSTLSSLLNMSHLNYTMKSPIKKRNISLFNLIPAERTCTDINLEAHWCSCLQWNNIPINDTYVQQALKYIINYINKYLSLVQNNLCHQLELHSIHNAQTYRPNSALLKFSKSSDIDGRIPKYDDNKTDIIFYQITFETKPNQAIYEATIQYSNRSARFDLDLNHISRINAYKSSASCVEKSYSHLRKFCLCSQ